MPYTKAIPCTIFDHVLWLIQAADGSPRRAEIRLGECLLLFTSLDALQEFLNGCEDRDTCHLRPVVFSRNRKEFGKRAREAARDGVIGALFDPAPETGEAPFLQFAKLAR
jgi:hypothetical protein